MNKPEFVPFVLPPKQATEHPDLWRDRSLYRIVSHINSLAAAQSQPAAEPVDVRDIDAAFRGYGMAVRKKTDPPIPGEPLMSMAEAKRIAGELVVAALRTPAREVPDHLVPIEAGIWGPQTASALRKRGMNIVYREGPSHD